MIDDFEDGDEWLAGPNRCGFWGMSTDEGATFFASDADGNALGTSPTSGVKPTTIAGGRGASRYAVHLTGGGQHTWGAYLYAQLQSGGAGVADRHPIDASRYTGIRFFAQGHVPGDLRAFLATEDTALPRHGGVCQAECSDHYGMDVTISEQWQEHALPFAKMTQRFDVYFPFDLTKLMSLEFQVYPNLESFDYWLDDVSFY